MHQNLYYLDSVWINYVPLNWNGLGLALDYGYTWALIIVSSKYYIEESHFFKAICLFFIYIVNGWLYNSIVINFNLKMICKYFLAYLVLGT